MELLFIFAAIYLPIYLIEAFASRNKKVKEKESEKKIEASNDIKKPVCTMEPLILDDVFDAEN